MFRGAALGLLGMFVLGILSVIAVGDEPKGKTTTVTKKLISARGADEKAIRAADEAFVKAYNAGDLKAVVALFEKNAEVVDGKGEKIKGREEIANLFESVFQEQPGGKIEVNVDDIRFLSDDVALETGQTRVSPAGGGSPDVERFAVIFVKKDGHWLQSFVQEQPETNVSPHEHLKELDWMVGEWVDESEGAVAFTTCLWSEDKNYLLRLFTVVVRGKTTMSGTQRIGWDPLTKQIKSWVFDSDGGHSQGLWSRTGNQWFVHATGVLADGQTSAATQVITLVNKDLARWKSIGRTVGSKAVPDIAEFALVRKPPQPK